MNLYSERF